MWCEQRSQNEHKIGRKTDLFRLFSTSSKTRPYDFLPTFLLIVQISQIHRRTPLRWTVSQRGSHFLGFLGYITWSFLRTLRFLVNAATTFNERGLAPVSCSRFVAKYVIGSSTAMFRLFLLLASRRKFRESFFSPDFSMKMSIFSETFQTIFMKYCKVILHPKGPPRVKKHENRMNGMWATQSKWAPNRPKNRLVSTFFDFLKNSSIRFSHDLSVKIPNFSNSLSNPSEINSFSEGFPFFMVPRIHNVIFATNFTFPGKCRNYI